MASEFGWNEKKAEANLALARIVEDQVHSTAERREPMIGQTLSGRFVFTQRAPERVRLISARPGTRKERRKYEEYIL